MVPLGLIECAAVALASLHACAKTCCAGLPLEHIECITLELLLHLLLVCSSLPVVPTQDQDTAHKLWLFGHKLLFLLHMISHTLLHKAAPGVFAEPRMMPMVMGHIPYRAFTASMYQDGIILAGLLIAATAFVLPIMYK